MSAAAAHATYRQQAGQYLNYRPLSYLLQDSTAAQSYLQGASKDCPVKSVRAALHLAGRIDGWEAEEVRGSAMGRHLAGPHERGAPLFVPSVRV